MSLAFGKLSMESFKTKTLRAFFYLHRQLYRAYNEQGRSRQKSDQFPWHSEEVGTNAGRKKYNRCQRTETSTTKGPKISAVSCWVILKLSQLDTPLFRQRLPTGSKKLIPVVRQLQGIFRSIQR